jgi:hypothetical protein
MKRSSMLALSLAGLLAGACGDETPTDPSVTATTNTFTFTSTITGSPVAGASILVAGVPYTTGTDGVITLSAAPTVGSVIEASAPGFLTRATTYRSGSAFTLWEIPAGADANFVRQLVYNRPGTPETLWRPSASAVTIQLTGDLAADPDVRAAHLQAVTMATQMTGARVTFLIGSSIAASGVISMVLNPTSPSAATTFVTQTRGNITGGRVEYSNLAAARNPRVVAHELGHILGFGHAPSGLMCPSACGVDNVSPLDQGVFISMWQRIPGTTPMDDDRAASAASADATVAIRCDVR